MSKISQVPRVHNFGLVTVHPSYEISGLSLVYPAYKIMGQCLTTQCTLSRASDCSRVHIFGSVIGLPTVRYFNSVKGYPPYKYLWRHWSTKGTIFLGRWAVYSGHLVYKLRIKHNLYLRFLNFRQQLKKTNRFRYECCEQVSG